MKCEIISVGTELLLGDIVNTNAQYLSKKMAELGFDVYYQISVGDNLERISLSVKNSLKRSDIIITTGGLGPTDDDLTKEAISSALGINLIRHEESIKNIIEIFERMGIKMPDCNIKQGYIPEGCIVVKNENGTAPGIIIEIEKKSIILLPGPPKEMIPMFENEIMRYLLKNTTDTIISKTLKVIGIGESAVQEKLKPVFDSQKNPTIAPYAKDNEVHLRITAKASNKEIATNMIDSVEKEVRNLLGDYIYGYDEDTIESVIIDLLKNKYKKVALAESCTGGLVCSRLTNIPGASSVFLNGVVCYSNESKVNILNVSEDTLKQFGAVSFQTAYEMAMGVRMISNTDIGISITGIAGPDGGSEKKPVGLVFIGFSTIEETKVYQFNFFGDRIRIRNRTCIKALDILRQYLIKL